MLKAVRKMIKRRYTDYKPIFGSIGEHIECDESMFNKRNPNAP